eukprot:scaffold3020_cov342-Prasinococcus_capsulatus_cf.AAC.16
MEVEATAGPRPACRRRLVKPTGATDRLPLVTIASCALLLMPTRPVEAAPFANGADLKTAVENCLAADSTGACDCASSTVDCGAAGDLPITAWDTSQVTEMRYMFNHGAFNQDLSAWNTSQVTDMSGTFFSASAFNQDISAWNTSQVTTMYEMFTYADAFNQDISTWDTSKVTDMSFMFYSADAFNGDISAWDTSQVTDMSWMFSDTRAFNQNISAWNTSQVTDMSYMFDLADAFNQDISAWDTSRVTDMSWMFFEASAFNQDITSWNDTAVVNSGSMFAGASRWHAAFSRTPSSPADDGPPSAWTSKGGVSGDPHFKCPHTAARFDFDGNQEVEGGREFYTMLSDSTTKTTLNVALQTHAFEGQYLQKLFTHVTEVYIVVAHVDFALTFGSRDAFPVLHYSNASTVLDSMADEKYVSVRHRSCEYMQPEKYRFSKQEDRQYVYPQTSNKCTVVQVHLPTLSVDILAVPAGLEVDGVGKDVVHSMSCSLSKRWHDRLRMLVKSWTHSKNVRGILSHCFDGSLLGKKCPECFGDRIESLKELPGVADLDNLLPDGMITSKGFDIQGDHPFEIETFASE